MKLFLLCLASLSVLIADDSGRVVRLDHYVKVTSTAPALQGKIAQIYVREVVKAGVVLRGSLPADQIVLFIHGAGTPAEVAFDVPYQDYSWMAYLADAGFDVFAMDMTGYGRSTRPEPMNDPCNLAREQQTQFTAAPCTNSAQTATTLESDWNDIGAVVDHLLRIRSAKRLNLIGWSLGGPRSGGYASRNEAKISRMILLSPAYRGTPVTQPQPDRSAFNTQSRTEFDANWDRQLGCPDQFDPAARESVWTEMLASDPIGATWSLGVRRAPNVAVSGWNRSVVAKMHIPLMLVAPAHDRQVIPKTVGELMADYGAKEKVLVDLACSSHNALWERNHLLLFRSSLEWLSMGTVESKREGTVRLGY